MALRIMKTGMLAIVLLACLMIAVSAFAGCDGTGGMGGQGYCITITQGRSVATTQPATAKAGDTQASGGNVVNINIKTEDGGTLTGNPSVGSGEATETTEPSTPAKQPPQ